MQLGLAQCGSQASTKFSQGKLPAVGKEGKLKMGADKSRLAGEWEGEAIGAFSEEELMEVEKMKYLHKSPHL